MSPKCYIFVYKLTEVQVNEFITHDKKVEQAKN